MNHIISEIVRLETQLENLPEEHTQRKYLEDKIRILAILLQEGLNNANN